MRSKICVGFAILTFLAMPRDAKPQALSETVVSITNSTGSTVRFSLGSADDETQKWIDGTVESRQTKAYKIWRNTRLRIAVTSGGFRIIRYFAVSPGERYRIGVDNNQLYDLRQLHARDLGETKLTPAKEEKEAVTPKSPKTIAARSAQPHLRTFDSPSSRTVLASIVGPATSLKGRSSVER